MTENRTQFDYLLNALELASQADNPAEHDYAAKRRALFAYVRELEAKTAVAQPGFPDKPLKPGAVVLYTVRGVDEIPMWVRPEDFPPVPKPAHRFDYTDLFTRGQMWEYILAERHRVVAQPANTDSVPGGTPT